MEQTSSDAGGASLNELQAIEQAIDALKAQIAKLEKENSIIRFTIKNLNESNSYYEEMEQSEKNESEDFIDSTVARVIKERDAEFDYVVRERETLKREVVELERINRKQKKTIEELRSFIPHAPNPNDLRTAMDSLKAKLGMNTASKKD